MNASCSVIRGPPIAGSGERGLCGTMAKTTRTSQVQLLSAPLWRKRTWRIGHVFIVIRHVSRKSTRWCVLTETSIKSEWVPILTWHYIHTHSYKSTMLPRATTTSPTSIMIFGGMKQAIFGFRASGILWTSTKPSGIHVFGAFGRNCGEVQDVHIWDDTRLLEFSK